MQAAGPPGILYAYCRSLQRRDFFSQDTSIDKCYLQVEGKFFYPVFHLSTLPWVNFNTMDSSQISLLSSEPDVVDMSANKARNVDSVAVP